MRKNTLKIFAAMLSATTLMSSMPMSAANAVEVSDNAMIQSKLANPEETDDCTEHICGMGDLTPEGSVQSSVSSGFASLL
ncbi:MAG: hypothetical protein UD936_04955 [Acutalibacteraceae bacterium]|nr:hypothetical protein [Acutalibacteraceae bacterium]